jgi:quinol monooxygenase YgiN
MLRTYLILRPAPNSLERLVDYYRQHRVIEAAVPHGLLLGELAHPIREATTIAVGSLWRSATAYDSWLRAPERKALIEAMLPLLDGPDAIKAWVEKADGAAGVDLTAVYGAEPLELRIRAGKSSYRHGE